MTETTTRIAMILTALILAGAAAAGPAMAQDEGIGVGERPEAPVLATLDGDSLDLDEVIGTKPVLVEFWATWCAICQALQPRMTRAYERFGDRVEFLIVAVGVAQDPAGIRRHLQRRPMPGTILWDGRGAAVRAFDSPGTGFVVILDATGMVAYTGTGTEQDIERALEQVTDGG